MNRNELSKSMNNFIDEMYEAEFGYNPNEPEPLYPQPKPKKMVSMLKRALSWKSHKNLSAVGEYIIGDYDNRLETVDGCKQIINEDLEYWIDRC